MTDDRRCEYTKDTLMATSTLCCFMCRYWTSTFLPISGKLELWYESLSRRVYSALVFFFSSSELKPVHVHSYKMAPTTYIHTTLKTNTRPEAGTTGWHKCSQHPAASCITENGLPVESWWSDITGWHGLYASGAPVCLLCLPWNLWTAALLGIQWSFHCVHLQGQLNSKVY